MQAVSPGKLIKSMCNIFPIICGCSFGKESQKFSGFYLKEELTKTELNLCFMKRVSFLHVIVTIMSLQKQAPMHLVGFQM